MNPTVSNDSNVITEPAGILSPERVKRILFEQDEDCSEHRIGYYPDIPRLAAKVRSSRNWTMGEIFVFAQSAERFLILKQIAPSSCEMLTITPSGIKDVITAYRYSQDDLVSLLSGYLA